MDEWSDPTPHHTPEQFKAALLVCERNGLPAKHRQMLLVHCRAKNSTISTGQLAKAVGYKNYTAVNGQYGTLAHRIADELHYIPPPVPGATGHWWRTLAYGEEGTPRTEDRFYKWVMRPQLVQALKELNWA